MLKIAVVFTGGTIGSAVESGVTDVSSSSVLIDMYREKYGDRHLFETFRPYDILSENLIPENWNALKKTLDELDFSEYNGIIITHGTDTLPYTAAVIGMLYGSAGIPIVMVSAGKILTDIDSNGVLNFASAVKLISEVSGGVYAVYSEADKNFVYLATRMNESEGLFDSFAATNPLPFGLILEDGLKLYRYSENINLQSVVKYRFDSLSFSSDILYIKPYPGLDYSTVGLEGKKTVLHSLYHSATAGVCGVSHSLIAFAERCRKSDVSLYICSEKPKLGAVYGSTEKIIRSGAKLLNGITVPAALAKLYIAYNQCDYPPEQIVKENLFFEHEE